jgi:hypothetical protein
MTQNVLQVASDDQLAGDKTGPALAPGARALLDHLNSALPVSTEGGSPAMGDAPVAARQAAPRMPSFGLAAARQADQIQHLIEQFDRLDRDTQVAELRGIVRDLCGVLNDVALRVKHDSSEVATKIGFLTGAVTIISSVPSPDAPHDISALLDNAKAAAERLASLERFSKDVGAAILALQNNTSLSQSTVRELGETVEAGRTESARLYQRIEATDQSLADGLAKVGASIEAERNEIAQLQGRIAAADQVLAQELTTSSERASMLRDDLGHIHERLTSVENSAVVHAGFLEKIEILSHRLDDLEYNSAAEINGWKMQSSERFAVLMNRVESLEQKHQTLSQDKEQTAARLQVVEQALATMTQSQKALSTWRDRITHVLLANPELPAV